MLHLLFVFYLEIEVGLLRKFFIFTSSMFSHNANIIFKKKTFNVTFKYKLSLCDEV